MGTTRTLKRLLTVAVLVGIATVLVAVPLAASANPDIDGFELDGNAAGGGRSDWDALGSPLEFTGFIADPTDSADQGHTGGGSKDTLDISQWKWTDGTVTPAKDNIANAYAAGYVEDGNFILYFGQDRVLDQMGSADVGFWFLQNPVGLNGDGTFSGTHAEGDVLVQSDFTNGGDVSEADVYKWQGGGLVKVSDNAECSDGKLGTDNACAEANTGTISTSWAGDITAPYFFEGGLNLTALFPGQSLPCFSTFITNTRSSHSESATLKDFSLGSIDTCGSIKITKQATPSDGTQFGYTATGGLNPGSFSLASGGTQSYTKLQPGSYSVTENAPPAGWALDSLTCPTVSGPGTSVTFDGAKANITLGFLGNVECTYVNKRQPQVRVVKVLDPANDPGKFDLQINGQTHADDVGNGGDTGFKQVTAGQPVTVGELAGAGTSLANYASSVSCDSGKGGAAATSHSFSVDFGDQVTCTITNTRKGTIVVEKQTLPDGSTQQFSFTPSYGAAFQLSDGQQNTSAPLAPGSYSVSESVPAGWSLTSATCDDGSSPSSIALGAGETVKCTFTNSKDGKVIVKKVMVGGTDTFTFTGTPAGSISANNGTIEQGVVAGQYVSTEGVTAGWTLTSVTCSDGNSSGSVPNRSATFNVEPNETVTCTFTNTKQSRIVVEKQTNPDGDTQVFGFNASYDANGFSLSDGQQDDSGPLAAGTYSVSENVPAGWDLKSTVCSDGSPANAIALAAGETVTCVFTNEKDAVIIVEKQTDPDGHAQVFSFSASYDANGFSLSDGQQNDSGDLNPGTYSVSENVPAGWNLTSTVCDDQSPVTAIELSAGETVTCVFRNTLKRGAIIVEKQTLPDGDPQVFAFTSSYDQDGFSLSDGQSNDSGALLPGTYSVAETVPAGWDLKSTVCTDGSPANAIAVGPDETVRCVFTNEKDANIVVEKQTNPNGDTQVFAFTASYDADGFSLSDGQQNDSGDLNPGTYSVSETVPQGWDLASAVCDDQSNPSSISLAAGETVTCVFTNEKDAKIIVSKQTLPDGAAQVFHFDASYDEGGFNLSDGQSNDSGDLAPGTYSVSEDVPAGWALTSAVCSDESSPSSISLAAGETVTCVFTNTKRGSIIVEKQTLPDGSAGQFTFTGDAAGTIGDNGQITVANLLPGTYTSTEAAAEGWNLSSIACSDANSTGAVDTRTATFRLEAGEVVKCTFTNFKPLPSGQGAIDVQKSADPTTIEEPGGPVTFSVTVTNVSNAKVALENVVDNVFGDLDDDGGNGCFDVPVNLGPGERVNCTFVRTVTGPGGTVHVNTVKAEGHDEFGNAVSDTDDARVEITPRLIDLVIVKEATSPTPLNGIVNYTMTVTNKGPNDATNVQVADPAPAGILYLTAAPTQGTCSVAPSLITCSLGTVKKGQTVVIRVTARATAVGTHTNTATVTGGGGRETNPADNVDSAVTVVPAPLKPPVAKPTPKPQPQPEFCLTLTVSPKMIRADGRPDRVVVKVTAGPKRVRGTKVVDLGRRRHEERPLGRQGHRDLPRQPT